MELKLLFFLAMSIFSGCNAETTPCGTSLYEERGEVEYKLNEYYIPGEKCVWTIRNTKISSSSFAFTKEKSNFDNKGTYLTIHTFGADGEAIANATLGQFDQEEKLFMRGALAVIVFTASSTKYGVGGRGFRITYNAIGSPHNDYANSTDLIASNTGTGTFSLGTRGLRKTVVRMLVIARNSATGTTGPLSEFGVSLQVTGIVYPDGEYCSYHEGKVYRIRKNEAHHVITFNRCSDAPLGPFYADDILILILSHGDTSRISTLSVYWQVY